MEKKNFIGGYVLILGFFIILLPELSKLGYIFKFLYDFGIIKITFILFAIGFFIDYLLNKKMSFLYKISLFEKISFCILIFILVYSFKHLL